MLVDFSKVCYNIVEDFVFNVIVFNTIGIITVSKCKIFAIIITVHTADFTDEL